MIPEDAARKDAYRNDYCDEYEQLADNRVVFIGEKRLTLADQECSGRHAEQISDASEHQHHVRSDRIAEAHGGRDRLDWREHCPRDAGQPRSVHEDEHVDLGGIDAEAAGYGAVPAHRPHLQPKIGAEDDIEGQEHHDDGHPDQEQPIIRVGEPPDDPQSAIENFRRAYVI